MSDVTITPEMEASDAEFLKNRPPVGAASSDVAEKDKEFLENRPTVRRQRFIKRHGIQSRITHDCVVFTCVWLIFSGLFVFVPPLAQFVGGDVVFFFRMSHRVIGVIYVAVPVISLILAPKGALRMVKEMLAKWDSDDKKWMALFLPYLFLARWIHMPDQGELKSGQRIADGIVLLSGIIMGVSGVVLLLGETILPLGGAHGVWLLIHDIGFFLCVVFITTHFFLGSGLFQPYRGTGRLMFGDGYVSESDALYHWGHWARKELEDGTNVVEKDK